MLSLTRTFTQDKARTSSSRGAGGGCSICSEGGDAASNSSSTLSEGCSAPARQHTRHLRSRPDQDSKDAHATWRMHVCDTLLSGRWTTAQGAFVGHECRMMTVIVNRQEFDKRERRSQFLACHGVLSGLSSDGKRKICGVDTQCTSLTTQQVITDPFCKRTATQSNLWSRLPSKDATNVCQELGVRAHYGDSHLISRSSRDGLLCCKAFKAFKAAA